MKEQQHAAPTRFSLHHLLVRLCHDDSGQDIVEYALVAVSMGLFTIAGIHGLAASVFNDLTIIIHAFDIATGGAR